MEDQEAQIIACNIDNTFLRKQGHIVVGGENKMSYSGNLFDFLDKESLALTRKTNEEWQREEYGKDRRSLNEGCKREFIRNLRTNERKTIEEIVKYSGKIYPRGEIYVFGSAVRKYNQHQDIDLLFKNEFLKELQKNKIEEYVNTKLKFKRKPQMLFETIEIDVSDMEPLAQKLMPWYNIDGKNKQKRRARIASQGNKETDKPYVHAGFREIGFKLGIEGTDVPIHCIFTGSYYTLRNIVRTSKIQLEKGIISEGPFGIELTNREKIK